MHINKKKFPGTTSSLLCYLTALFLSLLITGCSLGGSNTPPKVGKAPANKQIYTSPIILENGSADLATLDPALAFDQNSLTAISMIYTGLVQLDDTMHAQAQLASDWQVSSDGLTWTFHLKKNLKFSDGTPLTASDVAYSINRALLPATKSDIAPIYLGIIKNADKVLGGSLATLVGNSLQVVDATTLKIVTRQKAPYFLDMLAHSCSYVVEEKLIKTYGATFTDHLSEGGGSGPFKVKLYNHNQRIEFVPNPYYYGKKPQLNLVVFPFYSQQEAAYNDYAAGKVDTAGVPLAALPGITKRPDYHQVPQLWINYYTMNYKVAPFNNTNIRKAFALAIDKTAIAKDVWKNTVTPTNHILPEGMPGYNPKLTGPDGTQSLKGNPQQAQAFLKQGLKDEGWANVSQMPPVTLTYASGLSSFDNEVHALIASWKQVLGINVIPSPVNSDTLLDQVSAATGNSQGIQMWGLSWVGQYPDPQDWLTRQFDKGSVYNSMNYGQNASDTAAKQQVTQQNLQKADGNFQDSARIQTYQQAEQQLVNDVAWLPISQVNSIFLRKPYVTGVKDNGMGILPPDDWGNIYILQH